jgi:hypothetical protein
MTYLIGEFRETDAIARVLRSLQTAGISAADLDLFSQQPIELPRGLLDRPSRMSRISVVGAVAFGALATAFIYYTQHNYKLITGGMPLFSLWATGVITYEMTMLGAILATFAWFLRESGLAGKRDPSAPLPVIDPGSICLRVRCRAEQVAHARETLRLAGAIQIKQSGEV